MSTTDFQPVATPALTDDELQAWDWRAALEREERTIPWLARHTRRSESAVRKYASGASPTPIGWLRLAHGALERTSG